MYALSNVAKADEITPELPSPSETTVVADAQNQIPVKFHLDPGWSPSEVMLTSANGGTTFGKLKPPDLKVTFVAGGAGGSEVECKLPTGSGTNSLTNCTLTITAFRLTGDPSNPVETSTRNVTGINVTR